MQLMKMDMEKQELEKERDEIGRQIKQAMDTGV